jgi:energy-coupling factor transporter ATP-binding protein EcfA2
MGYLSRIETFGDVSAEDDDAVLSYFLKTEAVDRIEAGDCYAVIGRKGSGKTALTKYFSQPRKEYVTISPSLRDYPWNLHSKRKNLGASDIESYVSSWRYLIAVKANSIVLEQRNPTTMTDQQRAAREFLNDNYGGIVPSLSDILVPSRIKVSKKFFHRHLWVHRLEVLNLKMKVEVWLQKLII